MLGIKGWTGKKKVTDLRIEKHVWITDFVIDFSLHLFLLIFKDEQRKKGKRRSGEAEDVDRLDAPIKKQIRPKESLHDKCHKSGTKLHGWTLRWPKNEIFTGALTSNSQFWKFKKMQRK
jgi:hypothetical protein